MIVPNTTSGRVSVFHKKIRRDHEYDVVHGPTARLREDVLSFSNDLAVAVLNGLSGTAFIFDAASSHERETYLSHILGHVFEIQPPAPCRLRCRLRVATIWNDNMYDMLSTSSSSEKLLIDSKSNLTEVEVSRASDVDIVLSMAHRRQEALVKHFGWSQGIHTVATMSVVCSDVFSGLETSASFTAVDVAVSKKPKVAPFASVSSAAASREGVLLRRDHIALSELLRGEDVSKETKFREFMSDFVMDAAVHVYAHVTERAASHVDVLGLLDLTSSSTSLEEQKSQGRRRRRSDGGRRPPKWLDSVLSQDDHDDDALMNETKRPTSVRRGTFWGT